MAQATVRAGGTIHTSRFVKISGNDQVTEASANSDKLFGISQEFSNTAPIPGADTTVAAASGDPVQVYQTGDICYLLAGSGGLSKGDLVTAKSDGSGIAASAGQYYGAQALADAVGSTLARVVVRFGKI